jgi:L-lysine 6-transaminase
MQVCGIMVSKRVDRAENNVFKESSRINSTWGSNLVDMVRCQRFLEIIEEDHLVENAAKVGAYFHGQLLEVQNKFSQVLSNVRGRGLFNAFDLPEPEVRNAFMKEAQNQGMLVLKCGPRSIRFRPSLNVTKENVDEAISIVQKCLKILF